MKKRKDDSTGDVEAKKTTVSRCEKRKRIRDWVLLGFGKVEKVKEEEANEYASEFGKQLALHEFSVIYSGNFENPSKDAAEAFQKMILSQEGGSPEEVKKRLLCYIPSKQDPERYRGIGNIQRLDDYAHERRRRMVRNCDIIVQMAGARGSRANMLLAESMNKPVIPIQHFDGVGQEVYRNMYRTLENSTEREHHCMMQLLGDDGLLPEELANVTIEVIKWRLKHRTVFLAMPFQGYDRMEDVEASIRRAVSNSIGWKVVVAREIEVGRNKAMNEIIHEQVGRSSIVIADLDNERPNVYYEAGLARGQGKPVIFITIDAEKAHFDVNSYERITWRGSYKNLEEQLEDWLIKIVEKR